MVITVSASEKYDVIIEKGILFYTGELIKNVSKAEKAVIVTDGNVAPLYVEQTAQSLRNAGFNVSVFVFSAGEGSKNHDVLIELYAFLCERQITRSDLLVALGGGVTGDLTGFAAATFLRGINVVQIPTTLLSAVDSSVGGKTGVNIPGGKNLVGAFKQPILVICDPVTLNTLPADVFRDGIGEVVKYGAIKSPALFDKLMKNDIHSILTEVIGECVDIKRGVVERDEFESGERMLLNFGHTLGHAIEKMQDYRGLSHGMAVSAGMALITRASENAGLTNPGTYNKLRKALDKYGLSLGMEFSPSELVLHSTGDKKRVSDKINLVLLRDIGDSYIKTLSQTEFQELLK